MDVMERQALINSVEEYMENYEFTLWATLKGELLQFMTSHNAKKHPQGINCIINTKTKKFEFKFIIPQSTFLIVCQKCSPFDNKEHFEKMLSRFEHEIYKVI